MEQEGRFDGQAIDAPTPHGQAICNSELGNESETDSHILQYVVTTMRQK